MERMDDLIYTIRREIRRKNIKRAEIAELIGTSRNTVGCKLSGRNRLYADELFAICDHLGIDVRFKAEGGEWK